MIDLESRDSKKTAAFYRIEIEAIEVIQVLDQCSTDTGTFTLDMTSSLVFNTFFGKFDRHLGH